LSGRRLGATALGLAAGAAGFFVLVLAGYLLYQRVWGDSSLALIVITGVFGAAGAYAGWILGMIVFSAVRGRDGDGEPT
jgi:hypothetical protein